MKKIFLLLLFPFYVHSQSTTAGEWHLRKSGNGISVYGREVAGSDIDELKIVSTMHGSLSAVTAVIMDVDHFPEWIYMCKEARILKQVSPTEQYQYQHMSAPFPFSDRDVAIHFTIWQDPKTKVVHTRSVSVDSYLPETKDVVRLPLFDGAYELIPMGKTDVQVIYTLKLDPGGNLPDWLVNMTFVTGPYVSTEKMQKQVDLPQYANVKIPFIVEP